MELYVRDEARLVHGVQEVTGPRPWVPCPNCENKWCLKHEMHAYDCPCPAVGEDPVEEEAEA